MKYLKCERNGKDSPLFIGQRIVRCFDCTVDYKWVDGDIVLGRALE